MSTAARGPRARRTAGLLAGLALAVSVLTGCGGSDGGDADATSSAAPGTVSVAADGVQEITLTTGDDYRFSPATFTVAPGEVRLTVDNTADQYTHNFLFTAGAGPADITEEIPVLGPGESKTITFTVQTPGDYPFECSFHVALGQVGTMTVSG
ncbi:hypothetical protein GB931_08995 [Modestobacter sp. I12A-02628]|uniref:EfeO-type cupredoxin-like domain-containing protein n=1 Tax=Goekera deserti TaxID=2497753 RepID=A0A7K3WEJ3_9ACTN|nr:plastocyanin/azurin family copper-binding protein [Goekera deserti]MPQ98053.1 hypothetical protein [Goekera deserti]NDI48700.1 hypothetical protein [Goekera deserti]NEL54921.1 hypothetical protein [Goekera deserti]